MQQLNEIEKADLCLSASESIRRGGDFLERFPRMLRKIIESEAWEGRKLKTGEIITGSSLMDLVTSKPLRGWGITKDKVEALIREDIELLVMFREAAKGQEGGDTTNNNVISGRSTQGNSKAYTLARLSKESPELFAEVKAGKISANAAAIKAGWRKVKSPVDIILHQLPKLSKDEIRTLSDTIKARWA
jgi:hypothetical protein